MKLLLVDQLVVSGSVFAFNVYISSSYGNAWFGAYSAVNIVSTAAMAPVAASLFTYVLMQSSGAKAHSQKLAFKTVIILSILICIALSVVGIPILDYKIKLPYLLVASSFFSFSGLLLHEILKRILIATSRANLCLASDLILVLMRLIFLWYLAGFRVIPSVSALFFFWGASSFTAFIFCFVQAKISLTIPSRIDLVHEAKSIWNYSKWHISSSLLSWLGEPLIFLYYGYNAGDLALGRLRSIFIWTSAINPLLLFLENTSLVKYTSLYSSNKNLLRGIFASDQRRLILYIFIPYCSVALFFVPYLLRRVLGATDAAYASFAILCIFSALPLLCGVLVRSFLRTVGNNDGFVFLQGLSSIASIALVISLYPFGPVGVGLAIFAPLLIYWRWGVYILKLT